MMKVMLLVLLLCCAVTAMPLLQGSPVNPVCMAAHCTKQSAACFAESMCSKNVGCASECFSKWDEDKTPEKIAVQNCTGICTFSYNSKAYNDFMQCLGEHSCITFPSIPSTCRAPQNITILKEVPISEIMGDWWVVRGHNPVYDCYPCQSNRFKFHNSTALIYNPLYQVYLANGSLSLINQTGFLNTATTAQKGYSIVFDDAGFGNFETWWVIDKAEDNSYYLIYYCGNVLQWNFEGAIVFTKDGKLPDAAIPAITASYKKATGLDFSGFCSPATGASCPNQPKL